MRIHVGRFKLSAVLLTILAMSTASAIGLGAAAAAVGTPASAKASAVAVIAISGDVYFYTDPDFSVVCDATNATTHTYTSCANRDLSLWNNVSGYRVRFFYGPNQTGAWICFDTGDAGSSSGYAGNPSNLKFDQGRGRAGLGQSIWDNVHSEELVAGGNGCNPDE